MDLSHSSDFQVASDMACQAMHELAAREAADNRTLLGFMIDEGACERAQGFMDRGTEHDLQKTIGPMRRLCVSKTPAFQAGAWSSQFDLTHPLPQPRAWFEEHTKARNRTKM